MAYLIDIFLIRVIIIILITSFFFLQLDLEIRRVCLLAKAAISTNCSSLRQHIPVLLECMMPLFKSPLAAPHVVHVFVTLGDHVFAKKLHYLGMTGNFVFITSKDYQV